MEIGTLDAMIAAASEALAGDNVVTAGIVVSLATRWPDTPALAVAFALTTAAADLELLLDGQDRIAAAAYRTAALIAADTLAIEAMGQLPARAHHLLPVWRRSQARP